MVIIMERIIKSILTSITVLSVLLISGLPISNTVYAQETTPPGWWQDQNDTINALQRQISDLERMLSDATRPRPDPRPSLPNIRLVQPQSVVLTPGEVRYVDLVVRNIGNAPASNSLITATADGPFSIEFLNNDNILGNMGQNASRTVRARLTADASADAGIYSINLEFAFRGARDANNETSNDSISVRIDTGTRTPRITLRDFSVNQGQIFAGDSFVISAYLLNQGEGAAYNVQASIADGLDAEGIFLSGSPNAPFLQTVQPGYHGVVSFAFTASDRITSGTFPIVFELSGRDSAGEDISERFTYFVTVIAPATGVNRAFVSISNISTSGGIVGVNERSTVSMQVTNSGSLAARNIRITATPLDTEAIVPQSANVQSISVLEPGASQSLYFVFSPTSEATSQYHMVGFEITYDTGISGDLETDSFEQFVGINVYNPDSDENRGSRPRMLVSAYSVYPMIVSAGQEFDLSLTFQNTSSTRSVHNIKITLQAVEYEERSGAVFTTVGASNTLFIESLGPREEAYRQLRMFTVPNAHPRTYNIEVVFDYEDEDFEEFTETEQLSINVRQVTRLEVSNLQIPSHATLFNPVFVDFNIFNSGRVALSNLRVEMEGNFDTAGMEIIAGNMGRGNSASFSGQFTPEEPGEQHGVLIVSGEDETFELIEVRHEFTIFVEEAMMWDEDAMLDYRMPWDDPMDTEGGGVFTRLGMWIAIAVGALIVIAAVVVGIVLVVKKKRNNKDVFEGLQ